MLRRRRVTFVGCVKNSADALPAVLANIESLSKSFSEHAYIFVENDSNDNTASILKQWGEGKQDFIVHSLTGLDQLVGQRTVRLEICRNLYLAALQKIQHVSSNDVVVMLDMDNVNITPINTAGFESALNYLLQSKDVAAVTALQEGAYYDLWALRHPNYFNRDLWEDVLDVAIAEQLPDQQAFDKVFATCDTSFISRESPTDVDSAFGGLGIYKMDALIRNPLKYSGQHTKFLLGGAPNFFRMQRCEHVSLNLGFKLLGMRVVIHPHLVNFGYGPLTRLNPSAFRTLTF